MAVLGRLWSRMVSSLTREHSSLPRFRNLPTFTAVLLESSSLYLLGVRWLIRLLLRLVRILSAAVAVSERSRWAGEDEGTALMTGAPSMSACITDGTARAR